MPEVPTRPPTLSTIPLPLEEAMDPLDAVYEREDESQTTPEEIISQEPSVAKRSSPQETKEEPLPQYSPKVPSHEGQASWQGTSSIPELNTAVRPEMMSTSGIRWNVAHLHGSKDDDKRYKKKKKKKSHSTTEDPDVSPTPLIVAGIAAGILVLLCIVSGIVRLW